MTSGSRKIEKKKAASAPDPKKVKLGALMDVFAKMLTSAAPLSTAPAREQSGEIGRKNGTPQNRRRF